MIRIVKKKKKVYAYKNLLNLATFYDVKKRNELLKSVARCEELKRNRNFSIIDPIFHWRLQKATLVISLDFRE